MRTAIRLLAYCGVLSSACAHDSEQPPVAAGQTYESAGDTGSDITEVSVEGKLRDACEMHDVQTHFSFDSAKLHDETGTMNLLAACLSKGALKGRNIRIVGHADARGTDKYNHTLSQSRADSVAKFLVQNGVDKGKVITLAEGSEYAVGKNDKGRAVDRRIDIQLAD